MGECSLSSCCGCVCIYLGITQVVCGRGWQHMHSTTNTGSVYTHNNTILRYVQPCAVVGADGSFFVANFEKGGEATRVAYSQFVTAAAQ